jgi:hypothetical protein
LRNSYNAFTVAGETNRHLVPRIFDNIDFALLPSLRNTLERAHRADLCVGYRRVDRGRREPDAGVQGERFLGRDGRQARREGVPQERRRLHQHRWRRPADWRPGQRLGRRAGAGLRAGARQAPGRRRLAASHHTTVRQRHRPPAVGLRPHDLHQIHGKCVCRIHGEPSPKLAWAKESGVDAIYIRAGSTTRALNGREAFEYARRH